MNQAEREVRAMFPEGNYEDYWLDSTANSRLHDDIGWRTADGVVKYYRRLDVEWTHPDRDATEALMRHDTERGGGLMGSTTKLLAARASEINRGAQIRAWEYKLARLAPRR